MLDTIHQILEYIRTYWALLVRENPKDNGGLIGLPKPYLSPCDKPIFRAQFYWDSLFMAVGLVGSAYEEFIFNMTENLAHLFLRFKRIPNASEFHFLTHSQKPVFTEMLALCIRLKSYLGHRDTLDYVRLMMPIAVDEYNTVWMGTEHPDLRLLPEGCGLSRYFDIHYLDPLAAAESGWDHSPRCGGRWLDHLPVDLNSILYTSETNFAWMADLLGDAAQAAEWRGKAEQRSKTISRLMWSERRGFFFDYDFRRKRRSPYASLAGFAPMWAGFATPSQAARMVREWLPRFLYPGGLVTTLKHLPGKQWGWPNGWAPLQWLTVIALQRYGYFTEAQEVMVRWSANCAKVFEATGCLWEKYNVVETGADAESGLYGQLPGFGWTNAVFVDFHRQLNPAVEHPFWREYGRPFAWRRTETAKAATSGQS